jgi:hypothetical protein
MMKRFGIVSLFWVLISYSVIAHPLSSGTRNSGCSTSSVTFDASSIETIILHPEQILQDVDAFWEGDRAYWLVSRWLDDVRYQRPMFSWLPLIEDRAKVPAADRTESDLLGVTRDLMAREKAFLAGAIPHICSFIPDGAVGIDTKVYFTTMIPQNAFQKHYNVVVNVSHPDWKKDPSTIMNTLVHELFHVVFYRYEPLMTETQFDDSEKYDVLLNLMNEGMATYVAYATLPAYPAMIADYALLDDPHEVRRLMSELNTLLSSVDSLPADEFRMRMWTVGVQQRALYIAGGHAARTIAQEGGPEMLLEAMRRGPRGFVSLYNSLASEDERIVEYPLPETPSPFQRMRRAALDGDTEALRRSMSDVRKYHEAGGEPVGHSLHTTGQLLLHRGDAASAIEVFTLYKDLVPAAANPYEGLARAYMVQGDLEGAAAACRELLGISAGNVAALDMLAEIGGRSAGGDAR